MESLKRALESVGRMWATLSATQRVILGAAAVLMVVLLVVSSIGTTQSWVRVAGAEVDSAKRAAILKKLTERNQKHELRGSEIYVPKEDADRIVLDLAGEGSLDVDSFSKFLEEDNIFRTKAQTEMLAKKALEQRLALMIRKVDAVRNASVVTRPASRSFAAGFEGAGAGASVWLELHEGRNLTSKNVIAIAGLVAKAVADLKPEDVHIMDSQGNPYRAPNEKSNVFTAGFWREYERAIEEDIHRSIKGAFAFNKASVVVRIEAKNSSSEREDLKHGRATVIDSEEKRVKKGPGGKPPPRIKGEGPDSVDAPARDEETQNDTREKSVVDQTRTVETNPAGEIKRISVGVLIPVEEGPMMAQAERQLPKLQTFVLKAAGPQARPEDISVQIIPTKPAEAVAAAVQTPGAVDWFSGNWPKLVLGVLVLAALGGILRAIQRAGTQETVEELQALTTALTEEREAAVELGAPGETDLGRLKQGLQEMVGRNPQSVAASLKSFMSGR